MESERDLVFWCGRLEFAPCGHASNVPPQSSGGMLRNQLLERFWIDDENFDGDETFYSEELGD